MYYLWIDEGAPLREVEKVKNKKVKKQNNAKNRF